MKKENTSLPSYQELGPLIETPFTDASGVEILDLKRYVKDYLWEHPDTDVYVACDSQRMRKYTKYALVIVFHHVGHGGHVINHIQRMPRKVDLFTRLWRELELTAAVCSFLKYEVCMGDRIFPSLDYNPDKKHKSNIVHDAAVGYLKGMGFERVLTKPEAWAASCVADNICH